MNTEGEGVGKHRFIKGKHMEINIDIFFTIICWKFISTII